MIKLGVNIDHIATIREARKGVFPSPIEGALMAEAAGCHGITAHLREDRRHIQDRDIYELKEKIKTCLNMEMSISDDIVKVALDVMPPHVCLVPENRKEITTEGGLAVNDNFKKIEKVVKTLIDVGIEVSLFIDPIPLEIEASAKCGAQVVELHTGSYAEAKPGIDREDALVLLKKGAEIANGLGLTVNAGHGLDYYNTQAVIHSFSYNELNIGHSIIGYSVFVGLKQAVSEMLEIIG